MLTKKQQDFFNTIQSTKKSVNLGLPPDIFTHVKKDLTKIHSFARSDCI